MAMRSRSWLNRSLRQWAKAEWTRLGDTVPQVGSKGLRSLRDEARALRCDLDRFLLRTDQRVVASQTELAAIPLPGGTDWRWRPEALSARITPTGMAAPESGIRLGDSAAVWHDCNERALVLRQTQNAHVTDLAAFGLRLEVLGFTGSFLSLAVDLPDEALAGLSRNHIIRVETAMQAEQDLDIYARLNIGNGPNTEEQVHHLGRMQPEDICTHVTEFDLEMTEMNEKRLDKIWIDLIFEKPFMNAVVIREMIFSRHPRANV
ncbi:MAG: DUF6478 family protein [Paracoccus sp. (in: a-proteobacteria)]